MKCFMLTSTTFPFHPISEQVVHYLISMSVCPVLERWRLEKKLSSCPNPSGSDVELSEESDSALHPDRQPGDQDRAVLNTSQTHISTIEQDLQAQVGYMM